MFGIMIGKMWKILFALFYEMRYNFCIDTLHTQAEWITRWIYSRSASKEFCRMFGMFSGLFQ